MADIRVNWLIRVSGDDIIELNAEHAGIDLKTKDVPESQPYYNWCYPNSTWLAIRQRIEEFESKWFLMLKALGAVGCKCEGHSTTNDLVGYCYFPKRKLFNLMRQCEDFDRKQGVLFFTGGNLPKQIKHFAKLLPSLVDFEDFLITNIPGDIFEEFKVEYEERFGAFPSVHV